MANIAYAWELGAGLGHVTNFLPVALALRSRGHSVTAIVRDTSRAGAILGEHGIPMLQAPVWLGANCGLPDPPQSFAETLHGFGYLDTVGLYGLVTAWQSIFHVLEPDLVVADYAPTALLAVRGSAAVTATYGTGFCSPPRQTPLPALRPWGAVPHRRLVESESRVVRVVNDVLTGTGAAPLGSLKDLLEVDCDFLTTYAELDHYRDRGMATYWGPVLSAARGRRPDWQRGAGPRVFAYLDEGHAGFDAVLAQLGRRRCDVLVFAGYVSAAARARHESDCIRFSASPFDIREVAAGCDVAISHGGHGTTCAMLAAGRPVLVLPTNLEQHLLGRNVAALGAGILAPEGADAAALCDRLLDDPSLRDGAAAFARGYGFWTQEVIVDSIASRCESLAHREAMLSS